MALDRNAKSLTEPVIWERFADQFPVRERLIYLNHAAVAPLAKPVADAMKQSQHCDKGPGHGHGKGNGEGN